MRLDKFLKVARLIKRRTVANEVSESGKISVNGFVAKPCKQIKVDDIITINGAKSQTKIKVLSVPTTNIPVQLANTLYEVLES